MSEEHGWFLEEIERAGKRSELITNSARPQIVNGSFATTDKPLTANLCSCDKEKFCISEDSTFFDGMRYAAQMFILEAQKYSQSERYGYSAQEIGDIMKDAAARIISLSKE